MMVMNIGCVCMPKYLSYKGGEKNGKKKQTRTHWYIFQVGGAFLRQFFSPPKGIHKDGAGFSIPIVHEGKPAD